MQNMVRQPSVKLVHACTLGGGAAAAHVGCVLSPVVPAMMPWVVQDALVGAAIGGAISLAGMYVVQHTMCKNMTKSERKLMSALAIGGLILSTGVNYELNRRAQGSFIHNICGDAAGAFAKQFEKIRPPR